MPILRNAIKKLRQDKKRHKQNLVIKNKVKGLINKFKKNPSQEFLKKIYSALDTAAKKNIFHANKAARLKSRLTKLLTKKIPIKNKKGKIVSNPSKTNSAKNSKTVV